MTEFLLIGIWASRPVSEVPEIRLKDWSAFELKLPASTVRTRHFVGTNAAKGTARISTAIVQFDALRRRGITASGRVYELAESSHDLNTNAEYVWAAWLQRYCAKDVVNVTAAVKALRTPPNQQCATCVFVHHQTEDSKVHIADFCSRCGRRREPEQTAEQIARATAAQQAWRRISK